MTGESVSLSAIEGVRHEIECIVGDSFVHGASEEHSRMANYSNDLAQMLGEFFKNEIPPADNEAATAIREKYRSIDGMSDWTKLIPTALALRPIMDPNPGFKMADGRELTPATALLLRHTVDAAGVRARGAILAHVVKEYSSSRPDGQLDYLSLGVGTGEPTLLAIGQIVDEEVNITGVDIDRRAIKAARETFEGYDRGRSSLEITDIRELFVNSSEASKYDIGDSMGLVDYTDGPNPHSIPDMLPKDVFMATGDLIITGYNSLKPGGVFVFANLLPHAQIQLSKTAAGWPYIVPRGVELMAETVSNALVGTDYSLDVYRAGDPDLDAYAVYALYKP